MSKPAWALEASIAPIAPLATAAPNTAFRGVALAPTAPGTTIPAVTLTGGGTADFASGATLTATVTSGATVG